MRKWLVVAMAAALTLGGVAVRAGMVGASGPPDVTCSDMPFHEMAAHNLTVPSGKWCDVSKATISGNLQANGASGLGVGGGTVVGGDLQASNVTGAADPAGTGFNYLCNTVVHGNVQIHNTAAAGTWNIGSDSPAFMGAECTGGGSFVHGDLQFNNNLSTGNAIANNDIEGNFQCGGNGAVGGGPNGADGNSEGQCFGIGGKGDAGGEPQPGMDGDSPE